MKIELSGNLGEIKSQVVELYEEFFELKVTVDSSVKTDSSEVTEGKEASEEKEAPKKRGGKKTAKEVTEQNVEASKSNVPTELAIQGKPEEKVAEKSEAPKESKAPTVSKEAVNAALSDVASKVGYDQARSALLKFKANRISELKEEHFQEFINHCNGLLLTA